MPEIQNVGAVDYAQYQPSQYQYDEYANDYNNQPAIYDEENAEMKAAAKSHKGATALGIIVAAGLGLIGGRVWGKKSAAKDIENLTEAAKKYKDFVNDKIPELEKEADKVRNSNIWHWKRGGDFADKVKEELAKLKEIAKESKDGEEKTAEEVKKAVEDVGK